MHCRASACTSSGRASYDIALACVARLRVKSFACVRVARSPSIRSLPFCVRPCSHHADILELPGIVAVEILRKQPFAIVQRGPVAIDSNDIAEIGPADVENPGEIHLVRLDDAAVWVLYSPDYPGQHRCRYLQ